MLSGKYSGGAKPSGSRATDAQRNQFMRAYLAPETLARVDQLQPIARELGISPAQLALAWCLRHPSVASVIVGATRSSQLEENAKASGVEIPAELLARIDAIVPA